MAVPERAGYPSLTNLVSRLFPDPWELKVPRGTTLSAKHKGGHNKTSAVAGKWGWGVWLWGPVTGP